MDLQHSGNKNWMASMKQSLFMCDSTEDDGKGEIILDYVLSWSLRMASDEFKNKQVLHEYCRNILWNLISDTPLTSDIQFKSVSVRKEWNNIDLLVEVSLVNAGTTEQHAILIENKYNTGLHDSTDEDGVRRSQLIVYKKKFDRYYDSLHELSYHRHYALVIAQNYNEYAFNSMKEIANSYGFSTYGFQDLLKPNKYPFKDTESDIFNEFWLRTW